MGLEVRGNLEIGNNNGVFRAAPGFALDSARKGGSLVGNWLGTNSKSKHGLVQARKEMGFLSLAWLGTTRGGISELGSARA